MENSVLREIQERVQKLSRFLWPARVLIVLLIVAAVGTSAWYYMFKPCELNVVKEASALLVGRMNFYNEAYQFATTASRTSLIRPLALLQQIQMDTQQVLVPACMRTAKNELINYMGTVHQALLAFGAEEADATIRGFINQSETHYDNFTMELEAVNKCAPFCLP